MAFACKLLTRTTVLSLRSAIKTKVRTQAFNEFAASFRAPLPSRTSSTTSSRRFSSLSRLPAELGCAESLFPLHSAVALARLTSCLSVNSRNCRALSQDGIDGT